LNQAFYGFKPGRFRSRLLIHVQLPVHLDHDGPHVRISPIGCSRQSRLPFPRGFTGDARLHSMCPKASLILRGIRVIPAYTTSAR
jgi:hypothetical protein